MLTKLLVELIMIGVDQKQLWESVYKEREKWLKLAESSHTRSKRIDNNQN